HDDVVERLARAPQLAERLHASVYPARTRPPNRLGTHVDADRLHASRRPEMLEHHAVATADVEHRRPGGDRRPDDREARPKPARSPVTPVLVVAADEGAV